MKKISLKQTFAEQVKKGYPLISKDAVSRVNGVQEGELIEWIDERGSFLGKGYYGVQNKGIGWVLSFDANEKIDQAFFVSKLEQASKSRTHLFRDAQTTAFRVFNGEGDGIGGITIDYYDGFYLIQWYSEGVYTLKEDVLAAIEQVYPDYKGIYEKKRFDTSGQYIEDDDFVKGEKGEFPLIVKENGMNVAVYLNDGAMTGIFLDQRHVRKAIRDRYAKGKTVLNTFSYTGAFSVAAALGGASRTTSVDVANRSLKKTSEQFEVNGIDVDGQDIKVMDVFKYFPFAAKKGWSYDVVILDPPSFARTKKHTFSAAKDYKKLLKEAIQITAENGVIVASTNSSAFGMKKFKGFIAQAFKESGKTYRILEEYTLPEDFRTTKNYPEGNYLKVVFIQA
ncbi:class I SAM-dependent rRNA methyltransferase [Bacillus sp. CNPSo 3703]|uniref:class I SAM-dependent rRNA methyltransferase n=1 Tax=Bacillus altitudinis TaxID=293387 RepID=UPI00054315A7|nr:class I SAM-dependent rRNA methyltransferase [Bacillus altitudinis]KWZ65912.1 50S rRNA methyltransferase [Bacillus altitudinis]MDE0639924.1 class I SAM-dependent rRNA methyltransferase [Bacillus altitudinis]MEC0969663.1 class I SAM-dependent rRNA methyltransferase [Bacillus altitudinis]MEC1002870.1 class I SAM-dependent rRNA methyltransferase [Bacillus altitudinis]